MEWVVGEKIAFRPITDADTSDVVKWRNNERVREHFIYREIFTEQGHTRWLREKVDTGEVAQFIICTVQDKKPIGSVYFQFRKELPGEAEYGIFIGDDAAVGQGYGNETARLALRYAFDTYKLDKITLRVFTDNEIAKKSYENAGFQVVRVLKDVECTDGEKKDMYHMEVDKSAYVK